MTIGAEYGSFPVTVGVTIGDSRRRQRVYRVSTIGGETVLSHAEQRTLTEIRRTVQHRGHYAYVWKKETAEYLISTAFQPVYEPAVVDERIHGVQQLETAATSTLAHVQQFAVASTLIGWVDVQ